VLFCFFSFIRHSGLLAGVSLLAWFNLVSRFQLHAFRTIQTVGLFVNDEMGRTFKELVVAYCKVLIPDFRDHAVLLVGLVLCCYYDLISYEYCSYSVILWCVINCLSCAELIRQGDLIDVSGVMLEEAPVACFRGQHNAAGRTKENLISVTHERLPGAEN
jgi:hypothetical protein